MSAPKRTPGQREKDREIISEMWVQKVPQRIMAERLGISQSQVFREIQKLKQRWQESADCNTKEVIGDSLEELRYCKARLWEAYERSCKDAETSTTSIQNGEFVGEGGGEAGLGRPHAGDGPLLPGQATDYDSSGTAA
jgi:uncharacterized protein YjcR